MISKLSRFTCQMFDRAFKRSRRFSTGSFVFLISSERRTPKCAVVVGKKISKSAVVRNRLRRQIYDQAQQFLLPKLRGNSVICLYRGESVLQNASDIAISFEKLLAWIEKSTHKNYSS